jgi:hypothetical protein
VGLGYALRAFASGAPTTDVLSYAGVLEDGSGPAGGNYNIQVFLYDAATAGNILCQTTTAPIQVIDGHFSVPLPAACVTAVGTTADTWVDVLVEGSDTGRTKIGAVPYAVEAAHAVNADNATSAGAIGQALAAAQNSITSLQTAVSALQSAPKPLTTAVRANATSANPYYTDCVNQTLSSGDSFLVGACPRMAHYACTAAGYATGWFEGDISGGNVGISCVK